ncbi:MAG: 30S ribosomal protein S2 [Chlorobi bacterium]|nr:30S ribosomal protein S2 [Chlorobiota bacterium]
MTKVGFEDLLDAGVHFGHLRRKWNPNMAPYIFMERNGIHIIDLYKTQAKLEEAQNALKQIAKSGRKILFVATKKQAKDIVSETVSKINMPYITERWTGGMLTNFATVRKAIRKMTGIDKLTKSPAYLNLSKRERLQITRERAKLEKTLGSIADMNRIPSALFIVDINKEHIALAEAKKLNIPVFGMVDTNSDPTSVDFAIPSNDDASKSIALIVTAVAQSIAEGLNERKLSKDKKEEEHKAEVAAEDIKAKSKALEDAEAQADIDAEKTKVKVKAEGEKETARPKRTRKTVSKKK